MKNITQNSRKVPCSLISKRPHKLCIYDLFMCALRGYCMLISLCYIPSIQKPCGYCMLISLLQHHSQWSWPLALPSINVVHATGIWDIRICKHQLCNTNLANHNIGHASLYSLLAANLHDNTDTLPTTDAGSMQLYHGICLPSPSRCPGFALFS